MAVVALDAEQGDAEGEHRAEPAPALDRDGASVELDQPAGERQPQAGALALAGGLALDLEELGEDQLLVLGGDADPGVADLHHQLGVGGAGVHPHLAARGGELDRVAEQVVHHLLEFALVGTNFQVGGLDVVGEGEVAPLAERADHVAHLSERRGHGERLVGELHPPRLDLAEVEHVVDQLEQVAPRGVDVLQALLPLRGAEVPHQVVLEDLAEPEDGVERGAQLVAHVGEEFALVPADLPDLGVRHLDLALLQLDLGQLLLLLGVEPGVVDADRRLVGDDPHHRLLQAGEGLDRAAGEAEGADLVPG